MPTLRKMIDGPIFQAGSEEGVVKEWETRHGSGSTPQTVSPTSAPHPEAGNFRNASQPQQTPSGATQTVYQSPKGAAVAVTQYTQHTTVHQFQPNARSGFKNAVGYKGTGKVGKVFQGPHAKAGAFLKGKFGISHKFKGSVGRSQQMVRMPKAPKPVWR